MSKKTTVYFYQEPLPRGFIVAQTPNKHPYSFWKFMGDLIMLFLTCGVWVVWMIIRWIKNN